MARYIDADAFIDKFKKALETQQHYGLYNHAKITQYVIKAIENEPTADLVPKSEVERLSVELEAMRGAANSYKMHYEKAKSEVAREIIDELLEALQGEVDAEEKLDSSAWDKSDMIGHYMHQYAVEKLETLVIALSLYKKKYTEDQT